MTRIEVPASGAVVDYAAAAAFAWETAAGSGLHPRNATVRVHTRRERSLLVRTFTFRKKAHNGHSAKYAA